MIMCECLWIYEKFGFSIHSPYTAWQLKPRNLFIHKNASEKIVCEMAAILCPGIEELTNILLQRHQNYRVWNDWHQDSSTAHLVMYKLIT